MRAAPEWPLPRSSRTFAHAAQVAATGADHSGRDAGRARYSLIIRVRVVLGEVLLGQQQQSSSLHQLRTVCLPYLGVGDVLELQQARLVGSTASWIVAGRAVG